MVDEAPLWQTYKNKGPLQFDRSVVKKPAGDFAKQSKERIAGSAHFWNGRQPGQRWGLYEHVARFRKDAGYRQNMLARH